MSTVCPRLVEGFPMAASESRRSMVNLDLCKGLNQEELAFLERVAAGLQITSDVSRSDITLYCRYGNHMVIFAQASPHSIMPLLNETLVGKHVSAKQDSAIWEAIATGRRGTRQTEVIPGVAPVFEEIIPLQLYGRRLPVAAVVHTNLIEHERHRHRSKVFQKAVRCLQEMCWSGMLASCQGLSPFSEWDGILYVNSQMTITYASGVAMNLYRRQGYLAQLEGTNLRTLDTHDAQIVRSAWSAGVCREAEDEENRRIWIRKAIPMVCPDMRSLPERLFGGKTQNGFDGALILIHDATEARLKEQEIKTKNAMIQEIHHRVKNNLQTVASMLRIQQRRAENPETRKALQEAISRILSVSAIHEYLSHSGGRNINLRDVLNRVVEQTRNLLPGGSEMEIYLRGEDVYFPAQQSTACALVANELLQNAVEHGYGEVSVAGEIVVKLSDLGDMVEIEVRDNGAGLPPDFDLSKTDSLGLQIVRALVENELKGTFSLKRDGDYTVATARFPKVSLKEES